MERIRFRNHSIKNLSGQRFGRLTALKPVGIKHHRALWLCHCDCGRNCITRSSSLISGNTQSCGCLKSTLASSIHFRHGRCHSPEYNSWYGMLQRCENPNHSSYDHYGGRGIKVCTRWHKFENFYADMGRKPGPGYSIDRIDNDGDYEPDNCRWATVKEQNMNQRSRKDQKKFLACNWHSMQVFTSNNQSQFARMHGLSPSSINACLHHKMHSCKGWTFAFSPSES